MQTRHLTQGKQPSCSTLIWLKSFCVIGFIRRIGMRFLLIATLSVSVVGCVPVGTISQLATVGEVLYVIQTLVTAASVAIGG